MKHTTRVLPGVAGTVLLASALANIVLLRPETMNFFSLFIWIHGAVILLEFWVIVRLKRLQKSGAKALEVLRTFPGWVKLLAIAVLAITALTSSAISFDTDALSDATTVHSKNWHEDNGTYWLSVNGRPEVEITKPEYEYLQRNLHRVFAIAWLLLAYLILIQSNYVVRREEAQSNAA